MIRYLLLTLSLLAPAFTAARAELFVGDPAPKLSLDEFVRGEPIKEFAKGTTYVVEFWATWCGPCRESIPHLTEMQHANKEVIFLGVSVDEDQKLVRPFVEKQGAKMDYRVATEVRAGDQGKMAHDWLDASYQDGIPTAYIVNGDGKVAWIGPPMELAEPLKEILAGKWDLAAKAAEFKKAIVLQKAVVELRKRWSEALKKSEYDDALAVLDEASGKQIDLGPNTEVFRLALLVARGKDAQQAAELGEKLLAKADKESEDNSPLQLLDAILEPQKFLDSKSEVKPSRKKLPALLAKLVLAVAEKAQEGLKDDKPEDGFVTADDRALLARAYQAAGEKEKAIDQLEAGVDALNATIRSAKEVIKDLRAQKDALDGAADTEKPTARSGRSKSAKKGT